MTKLPKSVRRRLAAKQEVIRAARKTAPVVVQIDVGHVVRSPDGVVLAGPFATNAEAWRALDRIERQPVSPQEEKTDWLWRQRVESHRLL
ncbi:hypothetical protein ACFPOB_15930 [Bosea eneae]|uniref:SPOR domain-containing protein n=1 Tax=Bosea eneae TaxID=151454 RepID=A0ABW0ISN4_9HYPH